MEKIFKAFVGIVTFFVIVGLVVYFFPRVATEQFFSPTRTTTPQGMLEESEGGAGGEPAPPEAVAENLDIPWEVVFLPTGEILITERGGRLLKIGEAREAIPISGVAHRGEGGLLGLALHPNFSENGWVYLYMTTAQEGGLTNRVERYVLNGTALFARKVIIEHIPGANYHDGGRIAFGPDGMLYIGTGDAGVERNAQDTQSLAGKILRINDDGSIPSDNPFKNAVYSYGHRNVQGLAWDSEGQLWATEHGRSGTQSGYDELNKIMKGANYGWPEFEGDETGQGMAAPELHSDAAETWAPSGIAYLKGHMIFAGLRGESLYVADVSTGEAKDFTAYFREAYGRLRSVIVGPDSMLYVITNNTDGRGTSDSADDKLIRIDPELLSL